jgi:hypothetical protein
MSRQRISLHPLRVIFWTLFLLALVAFWLDRDPIALDAGDPRLEGRFEPIEARGDIVVVVSNEPTEAENRAIVPGSWAWVDAIRQEVGPVSVLAVQGLTDEALQPYRYVILTASATRAGDTESLVGLAEAFTARGGTMVVELPQGRLRTVFGADGNGGWRTPGAITAVGGVDAPFNSELRRMPLMTRFIGSTRPLEGAETLLAMDGAPVIYSREVGTGEIVVLDFDAGQQLSALQQGVASSGGRVRPRVSGAPTRTADLVASPAMLGSSVPWADLLERFLVHVVMGRRAALFAFWPWPDGANGALMTTHQSASMQGRPLWMSIHERSLDARASTFLAAPPVPPPGPNAVDVPEFTGHGALLWYLNPDAASLHKSWGALGFDLVQQPMTLVAQLEQLETWLGEDADIQGIRTWDGRWTEDPVDPFRIMDAVELRYSVSYSPAPGGPQGYLFGTCQPYTPVDSTGLPFRVQEVPVCFADPSTEEDVERMTATLERASQEYWTVHLLTSADRFQHTPSMAGFDAWRDALAFAQSHDMWVGGSGELLSFWRRRAAAELRVAGREVSSRDADGTARVIDYVVEADSSDRGLVIMIPVQSEGLSLSRVTRGARESQILGDEVTTREAMWLGRPVQLVAINPGFTTLGLRYSR